MGGQEIPVVEGPRANRTVYQNIVLELSSLISLSSPLVPLANLVQGYVRDSPMSRFRHRLFWTAFRLTVWLGGFREIDTLVCDTR